MKKFFIIPSLILGVVLCFVSCLNLGKGGNRLETTLPAVVGYDVDEAVPVIKTVSGIFAAPALASTDVHAGDCILAHILLDWDQQPKGKSLAYASILDYSLIDQGYGLVDREFDDTQLAVPLEDLLPVRAVAIHSYNSILNGKVFFGIACTAPTKQEMSYRLFAKPGADPADDEATLYIVGEKTNHPEGSDVNLEMLYAFDLFNVINELGKETTVSENSLPYTAKVLKIKVKYCTGVDDHNAPLYQEYNYTHGQVVLSVLD
jgi:hypothetical protein